MTLSTVPFDQRQLRDVLGTFVTGVTVVTTRDTDGVGHGVTVNSFSSVSLDPPLVLWSQAISAKSYSAFRDSEHFAVNILAHDQTALSNYFAKSREDKFRDIVHKSGIGGVPLLDDTAACLECVKVASYPCGDHVVYIGRVERLSNSGRAPLAFGSGQYMLAQPYNLGSFPARLDDLKSISVDEIRLASAALPEIAARVGNHTLCLAVWGNRGPTAIQWEPSNDPVSDRLPLGLVMPVTQSATGRAFAAFGSPELTQMLIEEDLRFCSESGEDLTTRRVRFEEDIKLAKEKGIARFIGVGPSPLHQIVVNAFSVPIYNVAGKMIMALSLAGPIDRLPPDWAGDVPLILAAAANEITGKIGRASEAHSA